MNHYRKIKSLILLLVVAVSANAQIEDGKVYNLVNVGNNTQSLAIASNNGVSITNTEQGTDYNQLWYVSQNYDNSYSLRNLGNGRYLRSSNAASVKWTMVKEEDVDDNCKFYCTAAGSGYTLRAIKTTDNSHYMHYSESQGTVVCWSTNAVATQWTMTEVSISNETLNSNWNILGSIDPSTSTITTYQTHLDNLFSDKACTVKKKPSLSESDLDYQALPEELKHMVRKVYNNSWGENNFDDSKDGWSAEYAQKYRVQLYEPYNEPECAASALGINAHTNLNNPTGIFANDREALYVMVEGTIKEGASLYIASYTGNGKPGGYAEGVELKQGLNVVPSFGEGNNYVINYVVKTFDTSKGKGNKAKLHKLSDFPCLKIHIEGGYINGYWNKMGDDFYTPDTNGDWEYIEARATQTTVTVLGEYITLQFPLRDADAVGDDGSSNRGLSHYLDQVGVKEVINEWDNVMMWERFLLGLLDKGTTTGEKNVKSPYSASNHVIEYTGEDGDEFATDYGDYYNVHGLSLGVGYNYMYGGWDHCGYNFNTMQSIIVDMLTSAGSHWGPGHEIGHQHQGLLNMRGLTEVTNNLFSNVVLWYFGETTSRVNGEEGSLSNVLAAYNTEKSDFFTNNIWAQTHMYYKLFLYYHVLGHNPKFYPRLFEMLRQDPMTIEYSQDGAKCLLHFYKKCCDAAGEDLTEFFRAYGFFRVMTNRFVGDYSNAVYTMTQSQIDAAIAEVKDKGYRKNIAVLFINDATDDAIKSHKGDILTLYGESTKCADLGSYASFNDNITPNYTYTLSGTTMTVKGSGGVGFAIFNDKDELIAFSDKKTFTVSAECAIVVASGNAKVKAVQADNAIVEVLNVMDNDDINARYAALGELLTSVEDFLRYSDADNTKPGFYKASVMATLQQCYDEAERIYNNKEVNSYAATYAALTQEYANIVTLKTDKTPLLPGSTYVLTNKKFPTTAMTLSANGMMCVYNTLSSEQQWTFEATDEKDVYYLKNGSNYLGSLSQSSQVGVVTTKELASQYKLYDLGKGLWAIQCQNADLQSIHCHNNCKVVGWSHTSTDNDGSWWYLTATAKDESMLPLYDLQNLIVKTEALVDEMAVVQDKGSIVNMSTWTVTSNATEAGHETKYLTDGDISTFFHTQWQGSVIPEYHNIVIDLGEHHSLTEFVINYTTISNSNVNIDAPKSILVQGSNDGTSYSDIATLSELPTTKGVEYISDTLGSSSQAYQYIRLQVIDATGGRLGNYNYFGLAELGLVRMSILVETISDKYASFISTEEMTIVCNQLYAAKQAYASGKVSFTDIESLQEQYNILLRAHDDANDVDFNNIKSQLSDLIDETESLITLCGTVTINSGLSNKVELQTTNPSGGYYVSTNAQSKQEGPISGLVDGYYGSSYTASQYYFHTDYSGNNSTDGLDHHITISLGEGNAVSKFKFQYWNRTDTDGNYIAEMKIYGKKGDGDYILITTLNDMPKSAGTTYESPVITCAEEYDYLRFMVTKNSSNNIKGGHPITHMAEFELTVITPECSEVELKETAGDVSVERLLATYNQWEEAKAVYRSANTVRQVQAAINKLEASMQALLAEQQSTNKAALRALVARATTLIDGCGIVTYRENTVVVPITLQATNADVENYLSCSNLFYDMRDNPGDSDTNCADLLDGDITSYIHTNYNAATTTYPHYLQVTFGAKNEVPEQFKFTYTTRSQGANQVPKKMRVEGSDDGTNYVVLKNYSYTDSNNPLPTTAGTKWTASEYLKGYAYLRFYVTMSPAGQQGAMNTTKPYFAMSEFGIEQPPLPSGYVVTWNEGDHGTATDELVIAAYEARNAANEVLRAASSVERIDSTVAMLRACYKALSIAKYSEQEYSVIVEGGNGTGGVKFEDMTYGNGRRFSAYTTLTIDEVEAIDVEGYIIDNLTLTSTTITVIYKKKYIVQVVGGEEQGGVVYDEIEYVNNDNIISSQVIDDSLLSAKEINGYDFTMTVKHDSSLIIVTYTLNKSGITPLREATLHLIASCYVDGELKFIGSQYVNDGVIEAFEAKVDTIQAQCNEATIFADYNNALEAWRAANEAFKAAMKNAEVDALERVEMRDSLNVLINKTHPLIALSRENPGDATEEFIDEVSAAVVSAQTIADNIASTKNELDSITITLQGKYEVLEGAQKSTAKAELRTLIGLIEALVAECGTYASRIQKSATPMPLQVADVTAGNWLSTNADQNTVGGKVDGSGIAALLDGSVDTYMHTQWSGTAVEDDHYVQVSLGEGLGLAEFSFTYATRKVDNPVYNSPAPSVIEVYGSTDGKDFTTLLATFSSDDPTNALPLYTEAGKYWTSAIISSSVDYEYLRFYVRDSRGPSGNTEYGNHHYFAMSEFALNTIHNETAYYVESLLTYGDVTEELFFQVVMAMIDATTLVKCSYDKTTLEAATDTLQHLYDALLIAHNDYSYLPVTLTTDKEAPVLYTINSKRGNNKVLQYDPVDGHMFSIVDAVISDGEPSAKQLFYFTQGTKKGQVYVHPFAAGEQVLAASDKSHGAAKVFVKEQGSDEAMQWTFEQESISGATWYSLKGVDAPYFSNYGGGSNKVGFYDKKDEGSRLAFTSKTVEGSGAYHSLKVYYDEATKEVSSNVIGCYRETESYTKAYASATELLHSTSDYAAYLEAYHNLVAANEPLELIMPVADQFYVIRSAHNGYAKDALVYANPADNKMYWATDKTPADATAIWTITPAGDGAFHICNLSTGTSIDEVATSLNESAGDVTIEPLSFKAGGQLGLYSNGMLHAKSNGTMVNYTTSVDGASAWRIEEVDMSQVKYIMNIGECGYADLYLNYPVTIPTGVKAYYVENSDITVENGVAQLRLSSINDTVLPAHTAVILHGTQGTYDFYYTTAPVNEYINLFTGSAYQTYHETVSGHSYYVFDVKDATAGLYKNVIKYSYNSAGAIVEVTEAKGTHYKMSANKLLLDWKNKAGKDVSSFRFSLGDEDSNNIKLNTIDTDAVIYDLFGRRIIEVVTSGIYIVNGEKRYIQAK